MINVTNPDPSGNTYLYPKSKAPRLKRVALQTKAHGTFILTDCENTRSIVLVGRLAETLAALVEAGRYGLTERNAGEWAWRLSEYIAQLRKRHGIAISRINEPHKGGFHGRYTLETPVAVMKYQPAFYGEQCER